MDRYLYYSRIIDKLDMIPDNDYLEYLAGRVNTLDFDSVICVQIPSFKDPELLNTVRSLLINAANPDRIRIKICYQDDDMSVYDELIKYDNCEIKAIDPDVSNGTCYARYVCNTMVSDEDFVFHIDSHMRFAFFWDVTMLMLWSELNDSKAILTDRPMSYNNMYYEELDSVAFIRGVSMHPTIVRFDRYDDNYAYGLLPRIFSKYSFGNHSLLTPCLSAGCVFGPASLDKEVLHNPHMFFIGDEIPMALRYYTHGYNMYNPRIRVVYHLYDRRSFFKDKIGKDILLFNTSDKESLRVYEKAYISKLFDISHDTDVKDFERYDIGHVRSLSDYEHFSKVDFKTKNMTYYMAPKIPRILYVYPNGITGIMRRAFWDFYQFTSNDDSYFVEFPYDIHEWDLNKDVSEFIIRIRKNYDFDTVIVYHPFWYALDLEKLFLDELRTSGVAVCLFIDDICSMQWMQPGRKICDEVDVFLSADFLIFPSEAMRWHAGNFNKEILDKPYSCRQIYDILTDFEVHDHIFNRHIVYTGNTGRCSESLFLIDDCDIHLFGMNLCDIPDKDNVIRHGYVSEKAYFDELSSVGGFNFVWADDRFFNMYYKYSTPYKIPNGIIAGLPIVIRNGSHGADFVRSNNIGWCFDSVDDAVLFIKQVSETEYFDVCHNIDRMSENLRNGYYSNVCFDDFLSFLYVR